MTTIHTMRASTSGDMSRQTYWETLCASNSRSCASWRCARPFFDASTIVAAQRYRCRVERWKFLDLAIPWAGQIWVCRVCSCNVSGFPFLQTVLCRLTRCFCHLVIYWMPQSPFATCASPRLGRPLTCTPDQQWMMHLLGWSFLLGNLFVCTVPNDAVRKGTHIELF